MVEGLAVVGGRHALRRTNEQGLADLVLELGDLLTEGGLRDVQLPRCLGEAPALDDLHEVTQLPHVHRLLSLNSSTEFYKRCL